MSTAVAGILAGRTALVTGASRGIGAGIAEALGRAGADVVVNYAASRGEAESVVGRIERAGGRAAAIQADMAVESAVEQLLDRARAEFGTLDVLVNNAGICLPAALEDSTAQQFHRQFDLNVLGTMLSTKFFAAQAGSGSSIVNISAIAARLAPPTRGIYSATKAAVDVLTQTHAKELGPRGIRVNAISPGYVVTDATRADGLVGSEMEKVRIAGTPLRRAGQPDDIAAVAVFLASEEARWLTGQIISASGGI
jgi:3-oxoacyl-[acyl-carrier protein] reductase